MYELNVIFLYTQFILHCLPKAKNPGIFFTQFLSLIIRGVTRALIGGGGGGCIFIYSCSARRISFEFRCF